MNIYNEKTDSLKQHILNNSPFPKERTLEIYESYFKTIPRRLSVVLGQYKLTEKAVIDVGCGFGYCLIRFGKGSAGLESIDSHVQFGKAIGLNVTQCNVEDSIPLEDGKYDAAYVSHIFEHVASPTSFLLSYLTKSKSQA